MRISRFVTLMVTVAAICSIGSAGAIDEEEPEMHVLHSQTFSGDTWVAYRVTAPEGSYVGVSSRASGSESTFGASNGWLLDAAGAVLSDYPRGTSKATIYAQVTVDDAPALGRVDRRVTVADASLGPSSFYHLENGGVFTLIALGSSDAEAWGGTVRLEGTEGVTLTSTTIGPAQLITEEQFEGMALYTSVNGYRIRRAEDGIRPYVARTVGSMLFGRFEGNARISYTGPAGGGEGRTEYVLGALPSGEYRFQMDTLSSFTRPGTRFDPDRTYVLFADVTLPE